MHISIAGSHNNRAIMKKKLHLTDYFILCRFSSRSLNEYPKPNVTHILALKTIFKLVHVITPYMGQAISMTKMSIFRIRFE